MKLQNKVAIVTGAAGGIGGAIARRFVDEGATLAAVDKEDCAGLVEAMTRAGGAARLFQADLSEVSECRRVVDAVAQAFGTVNVLVNCAGLFQGASIENVSEENWEQHLAVLARAPLFLSQAVVPHMKRTGGGRIINVTSVCAHFGVPGTVSYSAAKGALLAMTKAMMTDLNPFGINVNAISPGNTRTPINEHLRDQPGYVEKWDELSPSGLGFQEPDALCGAAVFLASDDGATVHGEQIVVDCGVSAGFSQAAISLERRA